MSKEAMELARYALKELVAQTEGRFFSIQHDHHAMQDARSAIRMLDEAIAKQEKEHPFGVYSTEDLNNAWKSGYDNCKAQAVWTLEDVKKAWKRGYASAKKECRSKNDCARSHPHEEMSKECELRTEIARLTNKLAQRNWIGLDAEEIRKTDHHMVCGAYHYSFKQGARWAEEKLKEKNYE